MRSARSSTTPRSRFPAKTSGSPGAPVGSIQSLDVCTKAPCPQGSPLNKAAVTITVDNADFTPFYGNAHCAIRPQSLIGEKYVDCQPGSSSSPPLQKISSGPGKGSYLLPVANTTSPVDSDIVQDISQQPIRQRFCADPRRAWHGPGGAWVGPQRRDPPGESGARADRQGPARSWRTRTRCWRVWPPSPMRCWRRWPRPSASSPTSSSRRTPRRWRAHRAQPTSRARSSCSRRSCASCGRSSPIWASSPIRARR